MPEDTLAFYKPRAGPGRALCPTRSLLQSHVDCAPAVIQHSGHPCSCWAFCDIAFPRLWEHSAKQAEGLFLRRKILTVFLIQYFSSLHSALVCGFQEYFCVSENIRCSPYFFNIKYINVAVSHSNAEHRKEGCQIVLQLQRKVKKAKWTFTRVHLRYLLPSSKPTGINCVLPSFPPRDWIIILGTKGEPQEIWAKCVDHKRSHSSP